MQHSHSIIIRATLVIITGLLSTIGCASTTDKQMARPLDWQIWNNSEFELCQSKPQYCHCGGYFLEPEITELPKDSLPESLYGIADKYQYGFDGLAQLEGDIILRYKDLQVRSESMSIDRNRQQTEFNGNVQLRYPGLLIQGPTAQFNLADDAARLFEAEFLSYASSLHGTAEEISITNSQEMRITKGMLTSCAPGNNAWHVKGRKIDLNYDKGWGSIHHMQVRVKGVPTLYVPYFTFPLDERRKSGFLYPQFNLSEPDLAFPYYLNLAPNYDATISPRHISARGLMLESEFRYLVKRSAGELNLNYLPKDGSTNTDRELASWQNLSEFGDNWLLDLNANYISDNDYFKDFGNSLVDNSASHLRRNLTIQNTRGAWNFLGQLESYQTIDDTIAESDQPYRRLPDLRLSHYTQLTDKIPLLWQNQWNYVYFAQPRAISSRYAHRGVWRSALILPGDWTWGYANAEAGIHQRNYRLSSNRLPNNQLPNNSLAAEEAITIPITSLDTGLYFERYTTNFFNAIDTPSPDTPTWQHTLEPRLFLVYIPFEDQAELPNFDSSDITLDYHQLFQTNRFTGEDRIGDTKQLSLGITQRLFRTDSTQDWLNLSLGQAYYLADRKVTLDNGAEAQSVPRSPIFGLLELNDPSGLRWQMQFTWDEQVNLINSARTGVSWHASTNRLLNFSYTYRTEGVTQDFDPIKQSELSFTQRVSPKWLLLGKIHYDLNTESTLEHLAGFKYESCCWQTTFVYHQKIQSTDENITDLTDNDYAFLVEVQLKSLGGLGGGLSKFLEKQIPGYGSKDK